jgi:5-methylcytosine-specific restriction endonuclease McrA
MMKACAKCNEIKNLSDFYFRDKKKGTYRKECKDCQKNNILRYQKTSNIYKEFRKGYEKEYHSKNKESINKKHREYWEDKRDIKREYDKEYRQTENGREIAYKSDMKRRLTGHGGKFKPHKRKELLDRDNWICKCCGIKVHDEKRNDERKAHIDHIIPISKGGNSSPENLQVLCRTCNLTKSDKIVI